MRHKLTKPVRFSKYTRRLRTQPGRMVSVRCCTVCRHKHTLAGAQYCPVCAGRTFVAGKVTDMIYQAIKLNENGKAVVCPHCSNEELTPGDFCIICGNEIVNRCGHVVSSHTSAVMKEGCGTVLPGNARFCYKCGNESTFYQKGWLKDWRYENTRKAIENSKTVEFDDLKHTKTQ